MNNQEPLPCDNGILEVVRVKIKLFDPKYASYNGKSENLKIPPS